jgi:serine/threonine-protein kinase
MDAGRERSTPFLALEYASGESLDVVIRQSARRPSRRLCQSLRVIADAIDASWAMGVGHGSLHPRDVFIDSGGTDLRISGFGVGQALEAVSVRVPLRRPYSAPERASGPGWDSRADVFSLGVIAHEMLSGQRPLGSDSEEDGVAADLSPDLRAAVRRVLIVRHVGVAGRSS